MPAGLPVNYSSWASHRLPDVFPDPHSFKPERFAPEERAKLPKGAYVPFGGGPRICIGMRFGELEIRAIAAAILRRFRLELEPGWRMRIRQMPTLSPRGGLPMQRPSDPFRAEKTPCYSRRPIGGASCPAALFRETTTTRGPMRLIVTEKNNSAKKIAEILSGGAAKADAATRCPITPGRTTAATRWRSVSRAT